MYTICYETAAGKKRHETSDIRAIEVFGRSLARRADAETVWNIAVFDADNNDVTLDFKCFQDDGRECPTCGAPADETGNRIPEHRPGSPCTTNYRAI